MNLAANINLFWQSWAQSPLATRLASILLHFVWQGAALGAAAFLLLVAMKQSRPQVRYAGLLLIFAGMAACPLATWFVTPQREPKVGDAGVVIGPVASLRSASPRSETPLVKNARQDSTLGSASVSASSTGTAVQAVPLASPGISALAESALHGLDRHRPWIATAWLVGVFALGLRLTAAVVGAERARRRGLMPVVESVEQTIAELAARLNLARPVRVFESLLTETPTLVGWLAPVILLPTSALCGLTPLQLRAILAHELAHVRRHDYFVNLLQTVVETLLFYHPAVWWISRRIRHEREICCDDMAVALCGDGLAYARALAALEEERNAMPALGIAARGGSLSERIRRILSRPAPAPSDRGTLAAVAVVIVLLLALVLQHRTASSAEAESISGSSVTSQATGRQAITQPNAGRLAAITEPASHQHESTPAQASLEFTFHVVSTRRKPVAGATVRPWAIGYGSGGSLITEKTAPPVKTDASGEARIRLHLAGKSSEALLMRHAVQSGLRSIAVRVDHPDHPVWSAYAELGGNRQIMLSNSTTIQIRAHREHEMAPLTRLFPVLSGSLIEGADWSDRNGTLTIRRVDIDSNQPSRWLRVVHVAQNGPVLFSDLVDLKLHSENPISLDLTLRPSVRVEGRLADSVPRPVRSGRVVAAIVDGRGGPTNWVWWATAEIAPDGRFVLDSLPADENLQLVALCDGWASASPTVGETTDYAAKYGFSDHNYKALPPHFVCPRLIRLLEPTVKPVVPMLRTATCEITVTDQTDRPLAGASVEFWPTQMFYNHVSNLPGTGIDALATIREQLASGKHRTAADTRLSHHYRTYSAKTNDRGVAIVRDIPLGGPTELESPTTVKFNVFREGYVPRGGPTNNAYATAKLLPAQTAHVTVRLKAEAVAIRGASLSSESDGQQAAATRNEGRLVASAQPASGKRDTEPALKPLEYSFHVVNTRSKPISGAKVTVWAVGWKEGRRSGSFKVDEKLFPPTTSDADGVVKIVFPTQAEGRTMDLLRAAENIGLNEVALTVDHPDHPIWDFYIGLEGRRRIMLSDPTKVVIRAHREHETGLLRHLYPVLAGAPFAPEVADWSERDGVLTVPRLDLTGEHAFGLLRVAEFPEKGPLLFSDLVDLKKHVEDPITLDLALKPGVRVEGKLDAQVPRPIRNGRVVAGIQTGHNDYGNKWEWEATATIAADGTFVFESLPPDENLQLIALCDGWVSTSPTRAEVMKYAEANQFGVDYRGPMNGVVSPHLYRLKGAVLQPVLPMRRAANCEVHVADEANKPLAGAQVDFNPNQKWLNGPATYVGAGADYATVMRGQLASGVHTANPNFDHFGERFRVQTDVRGVALVQNLPVVATDETVASHMTFTVSCKGYLRTKKLLHPSTLSVSLSPGETAQVAVHLKHE
jgi:beta-lactamase regulating signal transducer with metallopeptidase domain